MPTFTKSAASPSSSFLALRNRIRFECQGIIDTLRAQRPAHEILCLFANPDGEARLRLDRERRAIEEANRLAGNTLRIASCWATRVVDLVDRLLDGSPSVIHFAGHGEHGELLLDDVDGRPVWIEVERLLEVLCEYRPRCVLLNACHSATALRACPGIPYVIAMHGTCSDEGSIAFSRNFYHALARGCTIEAAFEHACRGLRLGRHDENCRPRLVC